jgi:hypothetical protein
MTTDLKSISILNSQTIINQLKKSYPADQQVKYLSLQTEIDLLLHQLKSLKS